MIPPRVLAGYGKRHSQAEACATVDALWHRLQPVGCQKVKRAFYRSLLVALVAVASLNADSKKLTLDQRVEIMRGLTAEYATVKAPLPRSKKPLEFDAATSTWDKKKWDGAGKELGPAARIGDLVQVTHFDIEKDRILLEINNGMKGKRKFTDHIQIGIGNTTAPIGGGNATNAPSGTSIVML